MEDEGRRIRRAIWQERRCIGHKRWSLLQYCNLYIHGYKHWHEALFSVECGRFLQAGLQAHRRRCQSEMERDGKTAQPSRERGLLFRMLGKNRGS